MLNHLINYHNSSLCDMMVYLPPATKGELFLRCAMVIGVTTSIIVAGILVKRAERKNALEEKQSREQ